MNDIQNIYSIQVLCGKGKTNKIYKIQTVWNDNEFVITVLDGSEAFQSNISESKLQNLANKYDTEFVQYLQTIKLSLCHKDTKEFKYNRKGNTFLISKQQNDFSVQFIDFELEEIGFNTASHNFIDDLMKCNDGLQNQILNYKNETEQAIKERNIYVEKLDHYVKEKKRIENELYRKFMLLLNEKKIRIQYLTEIIEKYKQNKDNDFSEDMENEIQQKVNNLRNKETISESDSDTDDENVQKITHRVQIEITPEKNINFLDDDDDDDDIDIVKNLPKRTKICNNNENNINNKVNVNDSKVKNDLDSIETTNMQQDTLEFNTQDLFDRI